MSAATTSSLDLPRSFRPRAGRSAQGVGVVHEKPLIPSIY